MVLGRGYALRSKVALFKKHTSKQSEAEPPKERVNRAATNKESLSPKEKPGTSANEPNVHIRHEGLSSLVKRSSKKNYKLTEATLWNTVNVKLPTDNRACWVTGIAIISSGQRLLVDRTNRKLKLYSTDMVHLTSLLLPEKPTNVCMYAGTVALITAEKRIFIVDINIRKIVMSLQRTIEFDFSITRITACRQNVFLTTNTSPPEVRKISLTGDKLWSVPDRDNERIFTNPKSIISYIDGENITVAVLDARNAFVHNAVDTLTIIDGATGEILKSCVLTKLEIHHGLAYDCRSRSFFVSIAKEGAIIELTKDLSRETVRFSTRSKSAAYPGILSNDLFDCPYEIGLDHQQTQLIISNEGYGTYNEIQIYDLTYVKVGE